LTRPDPTRSEIKPCSDDSHRGSFASYTVHVANLLCAQVNSASYPTLRGMGN